MTQTSVEAGGQAVDFRTRAKYSLEKIQRVNTTKLDENQLVQAHEIFTKDGWTGLTEWADLNIPKPRKGVVPKLIGIFNSIDNAYGLRKS
ncbi:hypothetical protein D3C81_1791170 [compost metagenome]